MTSRRLSGPCDAASASSSARAPDVGLQAAPVAAPADRPVLVDGEVPDLAGRARAAPEHLAAEDQPGADAVGELDVDAVLNPLQRTTSQLAQRGEVRGVVDRTGRRARRSISVGDGDAAPPGQDALGAHLARSRESTGAGIPRRPPLTSAIVLPAFSTRSSSSRAARSIPSSASWSAGSGIRCRPTMSRGPVARATRTSRSPKAMPGEQGVAGRERDQHGPSAVADARRELDRTGAVELPDHVGDGGGVSPVDPAISTWVIAPCSRSASSTRSRLASRREACEPGAGLLVHGVKIRPPAPAWKNYAHSAVFDRPHPGPVPPRWSPASEATGRDAGAPASRARRRPVDAIRPVTDPFPSPTGSAVGAVRRCWFDGR